ncbi:MAG: NAD(P)/FAD-dependent oxidoreductase [Gammaproteobacteria bacterium]
MSAPASPCRIVVIGGGAGGLELVTRLGDRLGGEPGVDIVLVDRNPTHIWKPLLHEVAAGTLNSSDDELPYLAQAYWHGFRFQPGALEGIDRGARTVTIAPLVDAEGREYVPRRTLGYDLLIIAIGSVTNDFGIAGVAEHCHFLDGRAQADAFHQYLVRACFAANAQSAPLREGQLHVAIAGAGATGVELAAELHHALRTLVRFGLDRIQPERDVRIHLVEGAPRILPGLNERISTATARVLESIGIRIHTGEFVVEATAGGLRLRSGREIPAEIKVWAAGIKGPDVLCGLDLETNRQQQLIVNSTLQTTRDPDIYALGDCAACPRSPGDPTLVPPRAQAAHQQAAVVADAIVARRRQRGHVPHFRYRDFGSLINLSAHSTVGSLMGNLFGRQSGAIAIEGWFARVAYLSLYKMHQVAVQGPVRTLLMTLANLLTRSTKPRLKLH